MAVPPLKAHQIDYSRFIPFHPNTKSGRPVFIDPQLMIRFIELIDITDPGGEALANAIVGKLKALAGSATSDSNLNNAAQHRHYFLQQNVIVTYTILQAGGQHRFGGVFITDLERAVKTEKSHPPGFYSATKPGASDDWVPKPETSQHLPTVIGVVGGLEPDAQGQTSIEQSATAFGRYLLSVDRSRLNNHFSLFYTPSHAINKYGRWFGAAYKLNKQKSSPAALAEIMLNTENRFWSETSNRYCWYVFGNGAKQLLPALRAYRAQQKHPLSRHHEFVFIDPKVPFGELKAELQSVGIELKNDMIKLGGAASRLHALMDSSGQYKDLHRNSTSEASINKALESIERQLSHKSAATNFVQIAKGLTKAVSGGWA